MADYNVTARFEADAAGYIQAVNQAKAATQGLGDAADKAGQQTSKAFTGSGQGLKQASDSATKAATSIKGVGDAAGHTGKHAKSAFDGIANGVQAANISLDGAAGKYTNLGDRASVAMQKATQGIRDHSSEMKTAGAAVTAVGGAWAAFNTTMAATGIQYNTLQQVSSKAMETMTGSAEAAAAQMERFHAFADESPFSRATFLEAQQQLMAFGLEAERVVPSLEGIENAVAAIGGGNAEIMQLTDILGAIQGQGKITGRELQRMGQMGIDAADIIGEQMGKSGEAIRAEITAGTLDADTAIEALTTGMSQRFEGAAAGLKDTFTGAVDRVKAAFRDLSGESFEWAVGSDGGGLFVDLLNHAADFMRAMQELPGPVKNALGIISTLGSTATVAAGGFMMLAPRAIESWDAFVKLSNATGATTLLENIRKRAPLAGTALRGVGTAAAAAAAGFVALQIIDSVATTEQVHSVQDLDDALQSLANTGSEASLDRIFGDFANTWVPGIKDAGAEIDNLDDAMQRLANQTSNDSFQLWGDKAFGWLPGANSEFGQIVEKVENASDSLAGMVSSGDIEGASTAFNTLADTFTRNGGEVEDLTEHMDSYIQSLIHAAAEAGVTITESEALEWALSGVAPAAVDAAGGLDAIGESDGLTKLGEEADIASTSLEGVISKIQGLGQEFRNAFLSEGDMYAAIDNLTDALAENGATLDATTEAGQRNREALVSMFGASEEYAASILESGGATEDAAGAMRTAYDTMIDNADAMGLTKGEAQELAAELLDIPDGVDIDTFFDETAREMAIALGNEIEALPEHKVIGIAMQEDGSFYSIQESVDELGNPVHILVDVDGEPVSELRETVMEVNGHEVTVYVDDEGTIHRVEEDLEELAQKRPQSTVDVGADTSGAEADIAEVENTDATATVDTDADTSGAEGSIEAVTGRPWMTSITGVPYMSDAESSANTTARDRFPLFSGVPQMGTAESTANTTARDRFPDFFGVPHMGNAEGSANTTARDRFPDFFGIPHTGTAESELTNTARERNASINAVKGTDGVSGWLDGFARVRTAVVNVVRRVTGAGGYTGGVVGADFGLANGGVAGGLATAGLPKLASGGRLPYYGLGTDTILGIGRHGMPTALVDDGEWVVREKMSRKFHTTIGLINNDDPRVQHLAGLAGGGQAGRERLASSVPYFPPVQLSAPVQHQGPMEMTGDLYMDSGEFMGKVRGVINEPSTTRRISQNLASQSGRDKKAAGIRA